jgi:ClpX C4-type zinc finger
MQPSCADTFTDDVDELRPAPSRAEQRRRARDPRPNLTEREGSVPDRLSQATVATCSFCQRPNSEVATLVAGPGVFICDSCVALCAGIIAGKPASVPQVVLWELPVTLEEVLDNLLAVAAAEAQAKQSLAAWVDKGRSMGATWTQIGEALGMARQSAWERFSGAT